MGRMVWSQIRRQQKQLGSLPVVPPTHQIKPVTVGRKMSETMDPGRNTLIKKNIKFSSHIRKFRLEQLQSHI
jgi:hypothetical protein